MKNERDPWVQVKDESELREGMAVQARPCSWCRKTHAGILLGRGPLAGETIIFPDREEPSVSVYSWFHTLCNGRTALGNAIRDGRLFRIADGQLVDDAEPATVVRGREMERAR